MSGSAPIRPRPVLDQTHSVEIPEQVELSYTIAGLGSRLYAALVDVAIVIAAFAATVVAVSWGLSARGSRAPGTPPDISASWAVAITYLAQFALLWGYYVLFEALADGRTPGKRLMRLRVVHDNGLSISFGAAAVRNILRLVDLQPVVVGGIGIISMLLTQRGKRLGDIVAGTIVVRERPIRIAEPQPVAAVIGEPVLSSVEFELLNRYVQRRGELRQEARTRLAGAVAQRLRPHLAQHDGPDAAALIRLHERETALRARGVAARSDKGGAREQHALVITGRPRWIEFSRIVERAQRRGLAALSEQEVVDFAARYRELSADLARLQTAARGRQLDEVFSLGRLVATGHNLLYRGRRMTLQRALTFLASDGPREVRRSLRWVLAAALIFWVPAIVTFAGVVRDPVVAEEFIPRAMLDRADAAAASPGAAYVEIPDVFRPLAAGMIIANNIQVALGAFALGITFAVGTTLILLYNGIAIGGVAGLFAARGVGTTLLDFVAPHGVLELTAIAIAGGAGLLIGGALLLGGPGGRRATLVRNGRRAISMMAVVILFLLVAGLIEGLVSPRTDLSLAGKLAVSGASAAVLLVYLIFGGRGRSRSDRATGLELQVPIDNAGADRVGRSVHDRDA